MANPVPFVNAKLFVGGVDLSADHNAGTLEFSAASLEATAFGDTSRVRKGGLTTGRVTGRGFVRFGRNLLDPTYFDDLGVDGTVLTVFPNAIAEGSTSSGFGYAMKSVETQYRLGGTVGELLTFDVVLEGRGISA